MFGFGARTIALVDTTASSPFAELSMIPALTLVWMFEVDRGAYGHLPELVITAVTIGFVVPLVGILAFGRRAT